MNYLLNRIKPRVHKLVMQSYFLLRVKLSLFSKKRRIVIVKNDSIGDYIIFRNFLKEIKNSANFKDYQIYLLTTSKLKPIAKELDKSVFEEILVFPLNGLETPSEKIKFFNSVSSYRFEYLLHPTYSPESKTHYLIKHISARYKVGFKGDLSNQTLEEKKYYEKYYTNLIAVKNEFSHEFEKNKNFFEAVLKQKLAISQTEFDRKSIQYVKNKIVICPGAQHRFRIWSLVNFATLITLLNQEFPQFIFVVVTGPGEDALFSEIEKETSVSLTHFRIDSIIELINLISEAKLVVCNDSSAAHISVACKTSSICISNGNHLGRFVPYPEDMYVNQKVILPPSLLNNLSDNSLKEYYFGSKLDINEISADSVFEQCVSMFSK